MNDFNPSQDFAGFVFLAIDHGFTSIEDGGGPLVPFTMTVDPAGQKKFARFAMEKLEDGVGAAKNSVASTGAIAMYAIALKASSLSAPNLQTHHGAPLNRKFSCLRVADGD
ncbi:hypothetical protein RsS62_07340 [Rhizobium dioscoreae]|uniref:hypothetical protein n=1 Tax=Rhizobium TaxID=379 RepID=UPI001260A36E|nr:hypothetical protein [Rhizobium dioscoreae]GES41482.1 hypothetical protein RsS62_07340 [Rhizobium dioscoreae]